MAKEAKRLLTFSAWTAPREDVCLTVGFSFSPVSFQRLQGEKEVLYNDSRSEPHSTTAKARGFRSNPAANNARE